MPDSNRAPLLLGALALLMAVAGVLAPRGAAPAVHRAGSPFELLLFGTSLDGERLRSDALPLLVHRVPAGVELWLTDVDATSTGLVLWRGASNQLEQVGFVVDRAAVGLGQSSRSYATPIRFGPGDELLVGPAGADVEWAALRGVVTPMGQSLAGSSR
jgi:hypothetical protein